MTTYEPSKVRITNEETLLQSIVKLEKKYPAILFEEVEKSGLLGTPHGLGGNGKDETDCGKFAQDILARIGIHLWSRDCEDIYDQFEEAHLLVDTLSSARTGDLLFFKNTYGDMDDTITHVGFYVNKDTLLHTSSSVGVAYTHDMKYYWIQHFAAVGKLNLNAK